MFLAALLLTASIANPDTLRLTYEFSPVADTAAPVAVRLTVAGSRDSLFRVKLPDRWAGRSDLYRNIIQLSPLTPGTRIEATLRDAQKVVRTRPGAPLGLTWRLAATPPSTSSRDAHNHSDIGRDLTQLVGYDALIVPALPRGTIVYATFTFRGLAPDAPISTSFGSRRTPADTVFKTRTALGNLEHAIYSFGVKSGAARTYDNAGGSGHLRIMVRGHLAIADTTLVSAIQRVILAEVSFWRTMPPPDYLVSVGVAPRGSLAGMRITNAFVADIDSTRSMDDGVITLFAHELMHEWIGGILHPASSLKDSELSWFTEGFTDYEAARILRSSGIINDSAYVARVNRALLDHATSSARDSNWSAVVNGYWNNATMQSEPYFRGHLLAIALDAQLRQATNGRRSLDDVLRTMVHDAERSGAGQTEATIARQLDRELGNGRASAEIARYINGGPVELPANALGACATSSIVQRAQWDPGFNVDSSLKVKTLVDVRPGGPAERDGLKDGMKLGRWSINRGDASRELELGIKVDTATVVHRYLPAGASVSVQQWILGSCR